MAFHFGDILENGWASLDNPIRFGIFVRKTSKGFQMTDGKGKFWELGQSDPRITKIGSVLSQPLEMVINHHHQKGWTKEEAKVQLEGFLRFHRIIFSEDQKETLLMNLDSFRNDKNTFEAEMNDKVRALNG